MVKFLPKWTLPVRKLVWTEKIRDLCALPYPNHPKGCPNYGEKCPLDGPYIDRYLDLNCPVWLVHSEFNLKAHVEKMRQKHGDWTERQLRNVLYWQSKSRKQLQKRVWITLSLLKRADIFISKPEYYGVNVYATARLSGLRLEKIKSLETCRHILLLEQGLEDDNNQGCR